VSTVLKEAAERFCEQKHHDLWSLGERTSRARETLARLITGASEREDGNVAAKRAESDGTGTAEARQEAKQHGTSAS
jgi:hypothetical protein